MKEIALYLQMQKGCALWGTAPSLPNLKSIKLTLIRAEEKPHIIGVRGFDKKKKLVRVELDKFN